MKSLEGIFLQNFQTAFHEECARTFDQDRVWALPEHKRSYFRIESYLFGIDFGQARLITISSFARITATSPRSCSKCLQCLLEHKLFPLGVAQNKRLITAFLTKNGKDVFQELQKQLPGVRIADKERGAHYLATVIF
ncbi:MAG: hypothetical protein HXY51_11115 [Nitrospirae bacterium]|nr:hypothetical protein [Nitrospirota bacterium]